MKDARGLDAALLVLRVVLGLLMLYYGSQKLLGAFGGPGFGAQIDMFAQRLGVPPVLGAMAIFAEFFGGLGVLVGLLTRVAAFGVACTMAVAVTVNLRSVASLVASPENRNPIQGIGYPAALLAIAIALLLVGAGRYSLDQRLLAKKRP